MSVAMAEALAEEGAMPGLSQEELLRCTSELPPKRLLVVPFMAAFQGYACYVSLQHFLKHEMDDDDSHTFTQAAVCMHYGKLAFRVGHDIVFARFSSWMRVQIAMVLLFVGVCVPPVFVYGMGFKWMGLAFIHFTLLGIGIGTFEGVYLSVISPLGPATKAWAVMGPPLGMATVNILGLLITSAGVPPVMIYVYAACCMPLGMLVFWRHAPRRGGVVHPSVNFAVALRKAGGWLPGMSAFLVAKCVGSFVMDNTPGWYYVFNDSAGVPIWGPSSTSLMDHDSYFALMGLVVFFGDTLSRRVPYAMNTSGRSIRLFLLISSVVFSALGLYLESYATAILTLFAGYIAFFGNGLNYAVATRYIDKEISEDYRRAVYSIWCMIGDVGGIFGAALIDVVNAFFCPRSYPHECLH